MSNILRFFQGLIPRNLDDALVLVLILVVVIVVITLLSAFRRPRS